MDAFSVTDLGSSDNADNISKSDAQVVSDHSVHPDLVVGAIVGGQHDGDGFLSLFALSR